MQPRLGILLEVNPVLNCPKEPSLLSSTSLGSIGGAQKRSAHEDHQQAKEERAEMWVGTEPWPQGKVSAGEEKLEAGRVCLGVDPEEQDQRLDLLKSWSC